MRTPQVLSTVTPDGSTIRQEWDTAVKACCTRAITRYPEETKRILKGYAIVCEDGVLIEHGIAWVQSQHDPGMQYQVNGVCSCPDAIHRAPEGRCKHRWAKALYVHATKQVNEAPLAVNPRYYATYYRDDQHQDGTQGVAMLQDTRWFFTEHQRGDATTICVPLARLVLGGRVDLCDAQRAVDGESLGFKFGQPQYPSYRAKDENEYLRSEEPETVPYAKLIPELVCDSCHRPSSTPGLVLIEWNDSLVCEECTWFFTHQE